jgi:sporulation protein YlmC with PRC-barrel domain
MEKRIELGDSVRATDGRAGVVAKVIVDPGEREPGYIVVKRRRFRSRHIVVPVSLVDEVSAGQVNLSMTRAALDGFPDYEVAERHGRYEKPMPVGPHRPVAVYTPASNRAYTVLRRRNVPESAVPVEKGMVVTDASGMRIGRVAGLSLDRGRRTATHLLVQRPAPMTVATPATMQQFVVPIDLVEDVREGEIRLRITRWHLSGLAVYGPAGESKQRA